MDTGPAIIVASYLLLFLVGFYMGRVMSGGS